MHETATYNDQSSIVYRLERAERGERNTTLNWAAYNFGQLVHAGYDETVARQTCRQARGRVSRTVRRGRRAPQDRPRR